MPRVVMSAARAPLPWRSALVTTVVAWASHVTSAGAAPRRCVAVASASSTPWQKSRGVVGTLTTPISPLLSSTSTTSVNVPPMSTPIRQLMRHSSPCPLRSPLTRHRDGLPPHTPAAVRVLGRAPSAASKIWSVRATSSSVWASET